MKKKAIAVTSESIADIPQSLLKDCNIAVIPHKVETENGIFEDGCEIDSEGLLDYMADDRTVTTSAPSAEEYEAFFANALAGANNVIHINLSSKVNNSGYFRAIEGAAAFNNVTVFDTGHLSSGQGLMAIEACKMASDGMSVGEILNALSQMRDRVRTSFIVDNLNYLAVSGQVSRRLAKIADAIMLHPVIDMRGGRITIGRFYFGTRSRAWSRYISSTLSPVSDVDRSVLFITHVGLTQKELDLVKSLVDKKVSFDRVYIQKASPTIAVNSGPGTFGLLYAKKKK